MKKKIYITPDIECIELSSYDCMVTASPNVPGLDHGGSGDAGEEGLSKSDFPWGIEEDW